MDDYCREYSARFDEVRGWPYASLRLELVDRVLIGALRQVAWYRILQPRWYPKNGFRACTFMHPRTWRPGAEKIGSLYTSTASSRRRGK